MVHPSSVTLTAISSESNSRDRRYESGDVQQVTNEPTQPVANVMLALIAQAKLSASALMRDELFEAVTVVIGPRSSRARSIKCVACSMKVLPAVVALPHQLALGVLDSQWPIAR